MTDPHNELPVLGQPPARRERADAARNRARVLAAAEKLFAARGTTRVTMDEIAAAAGVGKGTLYRRFADKSDLAAELLSDRAATLQRKILTGPPPLGPGADPKDRLVAFTRAYARFQAKHLDLVLLSEAAAPGGRLRKGSYAFWRQHVQLLLRELGSTDPQMRAEVLLAGLSAEQIRYWLRDQDRSMNAVVNGLTSVARALAAS